MAAGQQLRSLREQRRLRVRDVEEASRRIAAAMGDERYRISNGWLVKLEKCASPPNIHHLFALGATYRLHFFELLRFYGINVEEQAKYEAVANPHVTQLLLTGTNQVDLTAPNTTILAQDLTEKLPMNITFDGGNDARIIYAQLGSEEVTMYPLIRPGSILAIDTSQKKIETGEWSNKLDRPIYFVELREAFTCGWCERSDNKLRIISYRSSLVHELLFPQEAEIVGRVVAYYTRCVDAATEPKQQ